MNIKELKKFEKIYKSGEWICLVRYTDISQNWHIAKEPFQDTINTDLEIKLIHKKHEHILDAYLKGEVKKIEAYRWSDLIVPFNENCIDTFIEKYNPEYFYYADNKIMKPLDKDFAKIIDDNIMDLIDDKPKNNFKDYGFEADFEGDIFKEINGYFYGIIKTTSTRFLPIMWNEKGKQCEVYTVSLYNLTPIKKEWWENKNYLNKVFYDTCEDCLTILDWFDNKGNVKMQNFSKIFRHERFRLATKEEVKTLYYKEK